MTSSWGFFLWGTPAGLRPAPGKTYKYLPV
jgi:hypothetical protein